MPARLALADSAPGRLTAFCIHFLPVAFDFAAAFGMCVSWALRPLGPLGTAASRVAKNNALGAVVLLQHDHLRRASLAAVYRKMIDRLELVVQGDSPVLHGRRGVRDNEVIEVGVGAP